jgi:glycosyltransferase involved in cell wall biosynthesis
VDKVLNNNLYISIIIPVYNVQDTLLKCLNSIFEQQYNGAFEVIAVDDFSSDNSLKILKEYQEKESRLQIIEHKLNKKLSKARLSGMQVANGEYIMHVDSDDFLLPNTLNTLHEKCKESNADIVVFNYVREDNHGELFKESLISFESISSDRLKVQNYFFSTCWNKIIKRELLDDLIYGKSGINMSEDLIYATEILLKGKSIHLIPDTFYVYRSNDDSLTMTISPKHFIAQQENILKQLKLIIVRYKPSTQLVDNMLKYWEKHLFLFIAKTLFIKKQKLILNPRLFDILNQFDEMTDKRLKNISLSISHKYYSISMVFLKVGFLPALRILLLSFRYTFKKNINN